MKTLPNKLSKYIRAMESGDTEKNLRTESLNTGNARCSYTNRFAAHRDSSA